MVIMELQLDLNKRYTYADYLTWFDDKRRELIDGLIKPMSPAPKRIHQEISKIISVTFQNYLKNKKCKVYYSPFDVRFPKNGEKENNKIYTVVQPDICIICDLSKLDDRGCLGAPDMIIEIASENNTKHDVETKFQLYQDHGVREYWIVFPYEKTVNVFLLNEKGKYEIIAMYAEDSKVPVNIFNGELEIDLADVFEE
jgi:Uma2 family endonuclease